MTCPVCGERSGTLDTWQFDVETTYRIRKCRTCGHKFYTKEEECGKNEWGQASWRYKPAANKRKTGRTTTWDIEAGKRMWDDGSRISEIARTLGVEYRLVYTYAYNYWLGHRRRKNATD